MSDFSKIIKYYRKWNQKKRQFFLTKQFYLHQSFHRLFWKKGRPQRIIKQSWKGIWEVPFFIRILILLKNSSTIWTPYYILSFSLIKVLLDLVFATKNNKPTRPWDGGDHISTGLYACHRRLIHRFVTFSYL